MKKNGWTYIAVLGLAACLVLGGTMAGCARTTEKEHGESGRSQTERPSDKDADGGGEIAELVGESSDYSDRENWMKIPKITHEVDTIYLYPTCYQDDSKDAKPICDIDDEVVRKQAEKIYEKQGTVFEESTNVFAPYYRQSNIFQVSGMHGDELTAYQSREQRTDVYGALDYYFEHYNEGRPFILAGHSQGSTMIRIVLEEYMQAHPEYYERMVAAYPIGYSITKQWLEEHPHLKFAEGAQDTGVIVSWNTEGPKNKGKNSLVIEEGAISINPLNWKRDETYAPAEENLGSRMPDEEKGTFEIKKGFADARLDTERGVVVCTSDEVPFTTMKELFGPASLHQYDYNLYYENLRENVKTRVNQYLKKKQ